MRNLVTTNKLKLNRRQFLRLCGAATALALPTALGYRLLRSDEGESPPQVWPFDQPVELEHSTPPLVKSTPILILVNERSTNPFGAFLAEILRAEGLNCFQN